MKKTVKVLFQKTLAKKWATGNLMRTQQCQMYKIISKEFTESIQPQKIINSIHVNFDKIIFANQMIYQKTFNI